MGKESVMKKVKRLLLHKETIRTLTLREVRGGVLEGNVSFDGVMRFAGGPVLPSTCVIAPAPIAR